jgi:hypothetical protein
MQGGGKKSRIRGKQGKRKEILNGSGDWLDISDTCIPFVL